MVANVTIPFRVATLEERLRDMGLSRYFEGAPALKATALPLLVAHLTGNAFKRTALEHVLRGDGKDLTLLNLLTTPGASPPARTWPLPPLAIWEGFRALHQQAKLIAGKRKIAQATEPFASSFLLGIDRAAEIGLMDMDADMEEADADPSQGETQLVATSSGPQKT